jgi:integrase
MPFLVAYIEESKADKKPATVKTYNTTLHHLQAYQKKRKVNLNWDSIDMNFYNNLKRYMMVDLDMTRNAFGKNIRVIKMIMGVALERRYHNNLEFRNRLFKALEETADTIYLTEKELQKMLDLDLSCRPRLERLRDLFYVGSYTGLRFSDFNQIKAQNVEGNFFKITTEKGGQKVTIPLHPNVVQIMNKYDGVLPTTTNQELNRCLKDIGLLAGLTDLVTVTKMKASGKEETVFKKYERITTHTARRSFATNLVLSGFGSLTVMRITGHKTERAFLKYIRTTNEQAAVLLEKHWQDQGAHLKVA